MPSQTDHAADVLRREFAAKVRALVKSFPSLTLSQPAVDDDADESYSFATEASGDAGRHAAAFVRAVVDGTDSEFDFIGAYKAWDADHKAAFFRWCHSPFYPPTEEGAVDAE